MVNRVTDLLCSSLSFLSGMAMTMDMGGTFTTYNFSSTPAQADHDMLLNDWNMVGQDIRNAMGSYE